MTRKYILRSLAAAAASLAAKLIIKKIQDKKAGEQSPTGDTQSTAYSPHIV